jgi:hypothetical protein
VCLYHFGVWHRGDDAMKITATIETKDGIIHETFDSRDEMSEFLLALEEDSKVEA